jgi:hypothetical protein
LGRIYNYLDDTSWSPKFVICMTCNNTGAQVPPISSRFSVIRGWRRCRSPGRLPLSNLNRQKVHQWRQQVHRRNPRSWNQSLAGGAELVLGIRFSSNQEFLGISLIIYMAFPVHFDKARSCYLSRIDYQVFPCCGDWRASQIY